MSQRSGGGRFAGAAGLRPGLWITHAINVSPADQVLTARTKRLQMAGVDPSADRHVTHAQLSGSSLNGQQLVLFHAAEHTASCENDNTLRGFTGYLETCILQARITEGPSTMRRSSCRWGSDPCSPVSVEGN